MYASMQVAESRWSSLASKAENRSKELESLAQSYRNVTDLPHPEFGELGLKIIPMTPKSMPNKIPTGAYIVHRETLFRSCKGSAFLGNIPPRPIGSPW